MFGPKADPGTADQCRLGDIDIERAREEAALRGTEAFTLWLRTFTTYGKPKSWEQIRDHVCGAGDKFRPDNIKKARELFTRQPAIKAYRSEKNVVWGCPVEEFGFDLTAYVDQCRDAALVPYAVVKDGKWHGKGRMGWFGMSFEEVDEKEWNRNFHKLLTDLPPDTLITMVDCHI